MSPARVHAGLLLLTLTSALLFPEAAPAQQPEPAQQTMPAQQQTQPAQQTTPAQPADTAPQAQPAPAVPAQQPAPEATPTQSVAERALAAPGGADANQIARAWDLLTQYADESHKAEHRIQALAALSLVGDNDRAARLITANMNAKDYDVRTAAVLAPGASRDRRYQPALHAALDDREPRVAYSAAVSLWKMHDTAGEDVLLAVVTGDRKDSPGFLKKERHQAAHDLHDPRLLAGMAIKQGSGFFLGPFGFGLTAVEYARRNKGDAPRVEAIDQLATEHTEDVRAALVLASDSKDAAVRVAAAKALGQFNGADTLRTLAGMMDDDRAPVRLTAAAAYLRSAGVAGNFDENCPVPSAARVNK